LVCVQVALKLELHPDEVTTVPPPAPLFVLAPRLGYLPQVAQQALEHFGSVLPPGENEIWFEYQGVPLKWHIPTGSLFDLLSEGDGQYPWCLTVHFRSYPRNILQQVTGDSMQASYFNSLKESAYVLTGSSNSVMSLTKKSQQELWQNVLQSQDVEFFANMQKMDLAKPTRSRIPIRVYHREKVFDSFTGWKSIDYLSKSFDIDAEKDELTARHLFRDCLKSHSEEELGKVKLVVAGVELSLDVNVGDMYSHLKNADNWLYLVLKPATS